ncbi:MAG: hypothetical protein OEV14_10095 [Gammaproteobacteria bacterium]|nr:hypothetical protein [Gammaproteobacteria bacterium]
MIRGLTPPQRLWALFVLVFLGSTASFTATIWPQRDPGMVADLASPACEAWRNMPEGVFPDEYPEANQPCYAIRSLNFHQHVIVRSLSDYEQYLTRRRVKTALVSLGAWVGFSAAIYLLGRLSLWAKGTLPKWGESKAG